MLFQGVNLHLLKASIFFCCRSEMGSYLFKNPINEDGILCIHQLKALFVVVIQNFICSRVTCGAGRKIAILEKI